MARMSTRPVSAASGDSLRFQMERSIDELAELARSNVEPSQFFSEVLRKALQPGGANHVVLWRTSLEGNWEPIAEMPAGQRLTSSDIAQRQELLKEVAGQQQPRILPESAVSSHVLSPLRHSGTSVGILETEHSVSASGGLSAGTFQFFAALSEITADFLSQQELIQLRGARDAWLQWDQYQLRLGQSLELSAISATLVNDGRIVAGCDRITILIRHGRRYRVQAVSGVSTPDPRSGSVQSLEILVNQRTDPGGVTWLAAADQISNPVFDRHFRDSGAACLGMIPVTPLGKSGRIDWPTAIVVFESFGPEPGWSERQARAEALVRRSALALNAAIERSQIPWLAAWQRWRRGNLSSPGWLLFAIAVAVVATLLIVVPAEFTVSGHAEIWPALRRDVFASTTGIVDQILVNHGDQVTADQSLITLRDPELDQDVPRIAGEIATLQERLRGVQVARLTGVTARDATQKQRQLTTEEEELKQRLKTLERQRLLVEERRQRLTLRSPIAGQVLTWDIAQHLSARPVERGQSLLTIGETAGDWVVEIQVADRDVGPVLRARQALGEELTVEFQLASEPGHQCVGKIRNVSLATESDDHGQGHLKVVVAFDRSQAPQLRPGATAVPRIHCGRKSLGYVWLHDLIDTIRLWVLF